MDRRFVAIMLPGLLILSCMHASAELAVGGEGQFKVATSLASSRLHRPLSSIQLFLGYIDVHDTENASKLKDSILNQLSEAIDSYKVAVASAGDRQIKPVPGTPEDKQDIDYFNEHLHEFGNIQNLTERSLAILVVDVVLQFSKRIRSTDIDRLSKNIVTQQAFFKYMLQVEFFLNSITTVFRTG